MSLPPLQLSPLLLLLLHPFVVDHYSHYVTLLFFSSTFPPFIKLEKLITIIAFTRSSFAIAAASLDNLPTSAPFAAAAAAKAKALRCRNGKATSQSYTSKISREKSDLCNYSTNPVRDTAWIADQITLLRNCKRLHNEVTAVTAPRFPWKNHFVKQDNLNLFAFQTLIGLMLSSAVNDEAVIDAMKNLASKGLFLSIDALADASFSVVLSCLVLLTIIVKRQDILLMLQNILLLTSIL